MAQSVPRTRQRGLRALIGKALTIRGSFRGYSGHDCTVRSFVRGLCAAGVRVSLIDIPEWSSSKLDAGQRDPWFETLCKPVPAGIALQFCMPHQVARLRRQQSVNFTMFEAHPAPRSWAALAHRHPTIVPTVSSREAWIAAGARPERLYLCPLGVDGQRFRPDLKPLRLVDRRGRSVADYAVRILNVSDIVPRKNLLDLLAVWLVNTHHDDDAILIVKLTHGRLSSVRFMHQFAQLETKLGKRRSMAASLLLLDDVFPDRDMPRLYAAATHYWSMSCGEGWDQPMTEAAATGLRLIAPDHTAYRSYLDDQVATMLPAVKEPVLPSDNPDIRAFFEGATWWRPDVDAAGVAVRAALAGTDQKRSARARMLDQFGWDHATTRLLSILDGLDRRK